jgi:hypothetical protein
LSKRSLMAVRTPNKESYRKEAKTKQALFRCRKW